ncbi:MAG: protein kinase [Candidatus Melainabacteria bacterium]|nr:protein kinase [Candidatus Melainabacteria bacterium]
MDLCKTCGKRMVAGRKGSISQFVFRSDLCSCNRPAPLRPAPAVALSADEPADSVTADEAEMPLSADDFPVERFKPLEMLGEGAGGFVYLSRDRLLMKKVAVKTLRVLTPDQLIAFQDEAKATCNLDHPNIIKTFDLGVTKGGVPYMVLEYRAGRSLAEVLKASGPLIVETAVPFFGKLALALQYSHDQGIFHRDLKPENILIVEDANGSAEPVLIDFGVARVAHQAGAPTIVQGTTVVGTPSYMSPDQAEGLSYDCRSEVYSLSCVIYECLAGKPPFTGESALETIMMHARKPAQRLSEAADQDIPVRLEQLVARGLAKNPEERFQSMLEFAEALQASLAEAPDAGSRRISRSYSPARIATFALFLLVFGAVVATLLVNELHSPASRRQPKEIVPAGRAGLSAGWEVQDDGKSLRSGIATDEDLRLLEHRNVTSLDLSRSPITGRGLAWLRELPLETLDLYDTRIDDRDISQINQLRSLIELRVGLTAISDEGICRLSLPRLKGLFLAECRGVTDRGLDCIIEHYPGLEALDVADTSITTDGISKIAAFKHLTSLDLSVLHVSKDNILSLRAIPLRRLFLEDSRMTTEALLASRQLRGLQVLGIQGNTAASQQVEKNIREAFPQGRIHIVLYEPRGNEQVKDAAQITDFLGGEFDQ